MTSDGDGRPPITHVAVRFRDVVYSLPRPNRHHDVLRKIREETGEERLTNMNGENQGFLNESGRYLTRKQALISAQLNGQTREDRPIWHGELYSENLW